MKKKNTAATAPKLSIAKLSLREIQAGDLPRVAGGAVDIIRTGVTCKSHC